MHLYDEILTYSGDDRRRAWEFYLKNSVDGEVPHENWFRFMEEWSQIGNRRLMVLVRRGRYYGVDPTNLEAYLVKLEMTGVREREHLA